MINIKNKSKCCGCGACYNTCPTNAIRMQEDEYGFKYPQIDNTKCTNCGLCERVCPIFKELKQVKKDVKAYAAYAKNEEIRNQSSSGGIFTLLAEYIIKQGGVVFGAQFDETFNVEHSYVDNISDLNKFRGSKYIQSDIRETYKKVKEFLENNRKILFTGTPCQIEGLKSFLNKEYENLYTQDIICHGVPSPLVWEKYKKYRKEKDEREPNIINFRDKTKGWKKYNLTFEYTDKKYSVDKGQDLFMKAFLKNTCLRESCYSCAFKKENKVSDITLGDYWGIQNVHPEMDDDKGVSAVIANSLRGQELFEAIKENLVWKETEYEYIKKYNPSLVESPKMDPNRESFFENLEKISFDELVKKYTYEPSFLRKVINKLKYEFSKLTKK